jgi:hypothetical protein
LTEPICEEVESDIPTEEIVGSRIAASSKGGFTDSGNRVFASL